MNEYDDGATVRLEATLTVPVDANLYFELDTLVCHYGSPVEGLNIVKDPNNPRHCWVDWDSLGHIGEHAYHWYMRGTIKSAKKGFFRIN